MGSDRYPIIKQWTAEDEKRLSEMVRRGYPAAEIAEVLDRTPKAVRSRASRLGLLFGQMRKRPAR